MPEQPHPPPAPAPTPSTQCRDALGWLIELRCGCGRKATITVNSLVARFSDRGLWQVLPLLKCRACGASPAAVELVEDLMMVRDRRPLRRVKLL